MYKDEELYYEWSDFDKENEEENVNIIENNNFLLQKEYAGIIKLDKTFGRKNKRLLYKVCPYDKELPYLIIPYDIKVEFNKKVKNKYILFKYQEIEKSPYRGYLIRTIGDEGDLNMYYEYLLYSNFFNINLKPMKLKMKEMYKAVEKDLEISIIESKEKHFIFSIDNKNAIYYDDAISIYKENDDIFIQIYITNVLFYVEKLDLWDYLKNNVRNIYLPGRVERIFPDDILNMCSLKENTYRRVHRITFKNNEMVCIDETVIEVNKNYIFDENELLINDDYKYLMKKTKEYYDLENIIEEDIYYNKLENSSDLIRYWMMRLKKETNMNISSPLRRSEDIINWKNDLKKVPSIVEEEKEKKRIERKCRILDLFKYEDVKEYSKKDLLKHRDFFYIYRDLLDDENIRIYRINTQIRIEKFK